MSKVSFASQVRKYEPKYQLQVRHSNVGDQAGLKGSVVEIEASFTKWFTSDGQFMAENFHSWLDEKLPFLQHDKSLSKKRPES